MKKKRKSVEGNGYTKAWLITNDATGASKFYTKLEFKKYGAYKLNYGLIDN